MRARAPTVGLLAALLAPNAPGQLSCADCSQNNYNRQCGWPFNGGEDDPEFGRQWHIESIRACEAWNICTEFACISGAGVTIGIVDWGVWEDHEDLSGQYSAPCSESRPNPPPPCIYEGLHGTRMAGLAAGAGGNGIGGIGVAPGAKIGEIYLYADPWPASFFSELEDSIAFKNQCFDVKAMSFDLTGGGVSIVGAPAAIEAALDDGVRHGRSGLGMVYVLSAGNEADDFTPASDARCDYDGLVASRYTIAVGGIRLSGGEEGRSPNSERGSSLFVSAPGCGLWTTNELLTDAYGQCLRSSGYNCVHGTSFACPIVAGVVALMMEANPNLAWRDVMEAIVQTAATIDPGRGWQTNTAGLDHSYEYGHGLIDAHAAVEYVLDSAWMPLLYERELRFPLEAGVNVGPGETMTLAVEALAGMRIEQVELLMDVGTAGAPGIGPLEIEIERVQSQAERSGAPVPLATRSVLALARDDASRAYRDPDDGRPVRFTTVRHWGEGATATWKVRLRNTSTSDNPVTATWNLAELNFCGTPLCIADWDMDTIPATQADWDLYVSMWDIRDPRADLTGDRRVNADDISRFVSEYTSGCP